MTLSQLPLAARCPRCGAKVVDDAEIVDDLERALADIEKAKLRWPVGVAGDLRALERAMRCRLGTCEVRR